MVLVLHMMSFLLSFYYKVDKPLSTSHVMFVQLSHSKKQMLSAVKSQKTVKEITVEFSHGKD